jgi:hypothetical protein
VRQASLRLAFAGQSIPFLPVVEMALCLLRMACSEVEVKRVFARLRRLFGDHVRHSRGDLVESRLTIMMNNLDVMPHFMRSFSQMEQEVLGAPPDTDSLPILRRPSQSGRHLRQLDECGT